MYKVKALKTFRDKSKKMIPKGKVFKTDDHYAKLLIGYKLVKMIAIIQEKVVKVVERRKIVETKAKTVYKKKIIEPEENKEEVSPITTDPFKPEKKRYKRKYIRRSTKDVSI